MTFAMGSQKKSLLKKKGRFWYFATAFSETNAQISAPNTGDLMEY